MNFQIFFIALLISCELGHAINSSSNQNETKSALASTSRTVSISNSTTESTSKTESISTTASITVETTLSEAANTTIIQETIIKDTATVNESTLNDKPATTKAVDLQNQVKETIKPNTLTVLKSSPKQKRLHVKKTPPKVKETFEYNKENDDVKDQVVIEDESEDFPSQTFQVKEESHTKNPGMKTFEEEPASSNFPLIFMVSIVIIVGGYFLYHNKTKILGYLLEGGPPSTRRQAGYKKVRNLEEAMPGVRKHVA